MLLVLCIDPSSSQTLSLQSQILQLHLLPTIGVCAVRFIVMNEMHKRYNALRNEKYGLCGEGGVLPIEGGGLEKGDGGTWVPNGYPLSYGCAVYFIYIRIAVQATCSNATVKYYNIASHDPVPG